MSCVLKLHFKITAKIAQKGPVFITLSLTTGGKMLANCNAKAFQA